ncbi:hypothetical protein ACFQV2_07840 [Actinokineospora soli]|uniref:Uncharacterized protein n=1 Tax=Actinokineospora soli TaxID=1048753 RepID=A0ABW2TLT4_9PSEU
MEFLHEYGEFDDFPFLLVTEGIRAAHRGCSPASSRPRPAP